MLHRFIHRQFLKTVAASVALTITSPWLIGFNQPKIVHAQEGNSCANITNPLSPEEETYARVAWQYFLNNYQDTGFTNAAGGYPSGTLWDMGNYLMALNAARWLGLIDQGDFDLRLNKFLVSLGGLRLFEDSLPNKVYNTATGEMVDYGNNPIERGIGWSALDIGRILAAFHVLRTCHPQYSDWLQSIVDRWAVERSIQDGYMFGATVLEDGQTLPVQEGRLGYEEYASRGYELWGYAVPKALSYEPYKMVEIYGVPVPVDTRRFQETNANNYVVSESYILDGIEFGFLGKQQEFAEKVFEVQRRRYLATGQLTAVTEDNIDGPPYFLYNTVYSNGNAWATITEKNELYPEKRSISTKAAFGWRYIFPDSEYAQQLFQVATGLMSPDGGGFYAGLYEETNEPNEALTGNTNGLIMEILYYKARSNQPLIGGDLVNASTGEPQEYEVAEGYPAPAGVETQPAPVYPPPEPPFVPSGRDNKDKPQPPQPSPETPVAVAPPKPQPSSEEDKPKPEPTTANETTANDSPPSDKKSVDFVAVAPIPSVGRIKSSFCSESTRDLTIPEKRYAKVAWKYFEANYRPETGLVSDRSDMKATSLWGIGDYLAALQSATAMELVPLKKFDVRVRKLLATLQRLDLFSGELPHRGYDIRTLEPVDYGNNPTPEGTGWSGLDVGRILLTLHNLKSCYPQYTEAVDKILLNWSYLRVVRNGKLNSAVVEEDEFNRRLAKIHPVKQLGYEEYAARGFQLWGFDASGSAVGGEYETKSVDGLEILSRRERKGKQSEDNYVVADPFIRYGLELGFDPQMRSLVYPMLQAEAKRYQEEGLFSAANTVLIQKEPYIIHSTIVGNGEPWTTWLSSGKTKDKHRITSVATAFAYGSLFPEDEYAQELQQAVVDLYNPSLGYYEGFYETNGKPALGFSSSTNAIVLQSIYYQFRDYQPLLTDNVNSDSSWWKAIADGNSGNGLPEDAEQRLYLVEDDMGIYWSNANLLDKSPLNPPPLPTPPQNWGGNEWSPPNLGEIKGGWDFQSFSGEANNTAMDSPWWQAIAEGKGQGLPDTPTQKVNLYIDKKESYWTSTTPVKSQEVIPLKRDETHSKQSLQSPASQDDGTGLIKSALRWRTQPLTNSAVRRKTQGNARRFADGQGKESEIIPEPLAIDIPELTFDNMDTYSEAQNSELESDTCSNERDRAIDLSAAKQAWEYFDANWNESTGLVNAVENYPWTTLWDGGSAILGIHSARQLGIIDDREFERKITKFLSTLETLPLPVAGLPNKAYSTITGEMMKLDNTPDPNGTSGWSVLDTARFLIALHTLKTHYPEYQDRIDKIVDGWDLNKLERDGWLQGGIPKPDGTIEYFQEGRLGYEQYAAKGLQLWGIEADNALNNPPVKEIEVDGTTLKVDRRNYSNSNAGNYLTNDPYFLWGLELGWTETDKQQVAKLLQAQEQRYKRTGILTAVNEDSLDRPPYFLYYSVYANGDRWNATNSQGKSFSKLKFLSTKAAFAASALFPDKSYTQSLKQAVAETAVKNRGYPGGIYEDKNLGINKVFNVNTNAVILESLLYQSRNCPLSVSSYQ